MALNDTLPYGGKGTPEGLFWIAVASFHEDGDTEAVRAAQQIRGMVPAFDCYCDNIVCRLQRVTALETELNAEPVH